MQANPHDVLAVFATKSNIIVEPQAQAAVPPTMPPTATVTDPAGEPSEWDTIQRIIERHIDGMPRSVQKEIGPSELGTDCLHCLAAKLAGWAQSRQVAWLPYIGTSVHKAFEHLFDSLDEMVTIDSELHQKRRWEAEMRVPVGEIHGLAGKTQVNGSIDLFDRLTSRTIDWKIVGPTTIRNAKANGPSQQYLIQASLYGIGLNHVGETVSHNCIYFLPRNDNSLTSALPVEIPFDPQPGQWALNRANMLAMFLDLIENADGPDMRDAWIHSLPKSASHCFQCSTWPDDRLDDLSTLNQDYPTPPGRWQALTSLLEPEYKPKQQENK